jgi:YidC/Oxa1 family membrane protein insertase
VLEFLHRMVGNWGWAIVLLTVLIKAMFYPLSAASYRSMARMKEVTPRMMKIREQYGSDKQKMNVAMMELYKTEKINPLGGCLPILVQIPVFIALYWVLLASVEMRNAPWILWVQDLATPDSWLILPLLMMATMWIQFKLNPTPPDPVQAKVMAVMPIIFGVMFFFFPAGLVLYWLTNNILSIAQQWYVTRRSRRSEARLVRSAVAAVVRRRPLLAPLARSSSSAGHSQMLAVHNSTRPKLRRGGLALVGEHENDHRADQHPQHERRCRQLHGCGTRRPGNRQRSRPASPKSRRRSAPRPASSRISAADRRGIGRRHRARTLPAA